MYTDELRKFALVARVDILYEDADGHLESLGGIPDDNPAAQSRTLWEQLRQGALHQEIPFLMKDSFDVYFASLRGKDGRICCIGPMSTVRQSSLSQQRFYRNYGIDPEDVRTLRVFSLQEILYILELLALALTGKRYEETDLLYENHIIGDNFAGIHREQTAFHVEQETIDEQEDTWRHTYREEKELMRAIQEGRVSDALQLNRHMDDDTGRLASRDFIHWKSLSIVGITLCSRAAIEGGLSPETVYRVSGYYIKRCNNCQTAAQVISVRDQAVRDLTTRVHEKLQRTKTSNHTETCKNYIAKHYREKIYLEDVAAALGITPTYLSRLFKRDTGERLQDYINTVRVERAANLLKYSDYKLTEIAEYVNFPNQSYFGKIFKNRMHMTPKEYRDRYKPAEWDMKNP